jgi:spermidine synthase
MGVNLRRALYACVVFWSALLLLLVQPVLAKAILPWFGGSAGVWTTAMLFFQVLLLLGYAYAHLLHRRLRLKHQVLVHGCLLAASVAFLPLDPSDAWKPRGHEDPVFKILGLLATTAGLPYFVLSTTSPLLQSWYSRVFHAELPYRLFAISNLGSLVALLCYPVLIEPWLTVGHQLQWWSAAYVVFAVICLTAGLISHQTAVPAERGELPEWSRMVTWLALGAIPSVLWLAVGNQLSQEVAAVPFLWIMPLAIYLLTFVLCFDHQRWYRQNVFRWLLPLAWGGIVLVVSQRGYVDIRSAVPILLASLFLCCMFCHGELARLKPESRSLTAYYLTIAAGGALGGLFVALIAPRLFTDYLELPISVMASVVLALWLLYGLAPKRVLRIGGVVAGAVGAALVVQTEPLSTNVHIRNFYGILQTAEFGSGGERQRSLFNGTIQHGLQFLENDRSRIPTSYYGTASGAAIALKILQKQGPVHVGVIGLGVGTMATYGRDRDRYRFYEINPDVIRVAASHFRYLKDSAAEITVVTGDARLSLEREPPQNFHLLVVDAFSGDSIPVHLLTREAFAVYFRHLAPGGAVAVHVTNKHLELSPVVELSARANGAASSLIHNSGEAKNGIYLASWVVVTSNQKLTREISWLSSPIRRNGRLRLWTDDYSNLLTILR